MWIDHHRLSDIQGKPTWKVETKTNKQKAMWKKPSLWTGQKTIINIHREIRGDTDPMKQEHYIIF